MYDKFDKDIVRHKHSSQNKNKSYHETISTKKTKKPLPGRRFSINNTPTNIQNKTTENYNSASISKPTSNNNNLAMNTYSNTLSKPKTQESEKESQNSLKTPAFLYQFQHEAENRRMTIEMIKMMLKADPSYNNNPRSIVKELNLDCNILGLPDKIEPIKEEKELKKEESKESIEELEQDDKMKFLYHLVTPKIVTIKYKKTKTPVLIKIVPSNICYTAGVEFYDLKMDSVEKNKINLSIELLKLDRCFIIKDNSFSISLIKGEFFYKKKNSLKIYTKDKDETIMYALSLNYFSQLVKCKVYNKFYDKKV